MKKGVKNIQTVAYNGARTVYIILEKPAHITYEAKPRGLLHFLRLVSFVANGTFVAIGTFVVIGTFVAIELL